MNLLFISGGEIIGESSVYCNPGLLVREGKLEICHSRPPYVQKVIDANGLYISPGLIDMHVHGGAGADVMEANISSLEKITSFNARNGTTGVVLTVAAASSENMFSATRAVVKAKGSKIKGARILGLHLEGPYLNPLFKGAFNEKFLRRPDLSELADLIEEGAGLIRVVTVAPELPGGLEAVEYLNSRGILPSLGHSGATFNETREAFRRGLRHVTHFFNAMAPINHREPGPGGFALATPGFSMDVIVDGMHIHPSMLKILWKVKGNSLSLVTDAVAAAGMPEGEYLFAGQTLIYKKGRVTTSGGKLAGSNLTMIQAVRNMIKFAGLSIPEAIRMASLTPARILGLPGKGRIAEGYDADLVLLSRNLEPQLVLIEGEIYNDILKTAN